ncbi:hypothetical protein ZIOFF_027040 [Zingiber officinale]|uniref:Uncharacterized protein n=1 Tax=Zingiber officinale TaxID=94328 RepID=A0A8J5HHF0_ZINOF|nr:hypothetical protein ZIOFF_027040 [Zingiber officinale]
MYQPTAGNPRSGATPFSLRWWRRLVRLGKEEKKRLTGRGKKRSSGSSGVAVLWAALPPTPSASLRKASTPFDSPLPLSNSRFLPICERASARKLSSLVASPWNLVGFVWMEKESKEQRAPPLRAAPPERDFPLQWGSCKRLRCVKVREEGSPGKSDGRRRATSRINRRIVIGGDRDFPTPRFRHPAQLPHR